MSYITRIPLPPPSSPPPSLPSHALFYFSAPTSTANTMHATSSSTSTTLRTHTHTHTAQAQFHLSWLIKMSVLYTYAFCRPIVFFGVVSEHAHHTRPPARNRALWRAVWTRRVTTLFIQSATVCLLTLQPRCPLPRETQSQFL